eukprot:m.52153 g.52153  ORF g.52153 m.52153 type:complete len:374 (-) comp7604_c0_seq3:406-1527(-)
MFASAAKYPTSSPSLLPYKCHGCDGSGYTGWYLFSRKRCLVCNGQGMTQHKAKPCPLCSGKGTKLSFGISWQCHGCRGQKYLSHKWYVCEVCRGEGSKKSMLSASSCVACQGRGIVSSRQHSCLHCKGKGRVSDGIFSSKECPACSGTGTVQGKQYRCHSCDASGKRLGKTCPLCGGRCWLPFNQIQCQRCHGNGVVKGWFSGEDCKDCKNVGYIPMHEIVIDSDSGSEWDSGDVVEVEDKEQVRISNSRKSLVSRGENVRNPQERRRKKHKRTGHVRAMDYTSLDISTTNDEDVVSDDDDDGTEEGMEAVVSLLDENHPTYSHDGEEENDPILRHNQVVTHQPREGIFSSRKWCLFLVLVLLLLTFLSFLTR